MKKEGAFVRFVGVFPTVSIAGDVFKLIGFRVRWPVDGINCPMLDGGITSSVKCIGVSGTPSVCANTSLNRLFAGVACT